MPLDRKARQKAYDQKRRLDPEVRARKAEMTRLWFERNPDYHVKRRARSAELALRWHERNPGYKVKRRTKQKVYDKKRRSTPEGRARTAKHNRLWLDKNPGYKASYYQKRWLDPEFRAHESERSRIWREQNPGGRKAYEARRRKNDPAYRILKNCRCRVWHALIGRGAKSARTLELIGCSTQQLKLHLETQFDLNMTWGNYGTYWHIDHIFPCAKFDLSCPIQQRQCFHFSNLQPLEARENLLKKDHYARHR